MANDMEDLRTSEMATQVAERVARILMSGMQYPEFGVGAPTVAEVAKIMGKEAYFIREGIEKGWLPIGVCKVNENGVRSFYISPKMLWEVTGYVWKGRENNA